MQALDNKPSICAESFISYLSLSYNALPSSIYTDIFRLPPGHLLTFDLNTKSITLEKWFDHNSLTHYPHELNVNTIDTALVDAVRQWSLADSSVAISLSGGLDSGLITAISSQLFDNIHTYTLRVPNTETPGATAEADLARELSTLLRTTHTEICISPEDLLSSLPAMMKAIDEPYAGGLPSWFIYQEAKKSHKAILTGVGGDEIFGDYGKWRNLERLLPKASRQIPVSSRISPLDLESKFIKTWCMTSTLTQYLSKTAQNIQASLIHHFQTTFYQHSSHNLRKAIPLTDLNTQLPYEFLFMTDRFSMAHSMEARTPFLDKRLSYMALSLTERSKSTSQDPKKLLRSIAMRYLPSSYISQPKTGFTLPIHHWLNNELKESVTDLLLSGHPIFDDLLNTPMSVIIKRFYSPESKEDRNLSGLLWKLLLFLMWYEHS